MATCDCGCGKELTGKAKRWFSDEHKNEFHTRVRRVAAEAVQKQRALPLDGRRVAATLEDAVSTAVQPVPGIGTKVQSYVLSMETLNVRQKMVYAALTNYATGLSRSQIAQITGLRLSSVCGRVNELMNSSPPMVRVSRTAWDLVTLRNVEVLEVVR